MAEDANGYTVRHGDHYHYIWKSSLQYGQGNTGETIGKKGQITVLDNHSLHTPTTRNNFVPLKSTTEKGILPLSLIQRKLSQVLIIQQATVSFLMVAESKVKQR